MPETPEEFYRQEAAVIIENYRSDETSLYEAADALDKARQTLTAAYLNDEMPDAAADLLFEQYSALYLLAVQKGHVDGKEMENAVEEYAKGLFPQNEVAERVTTVQAEMLLQTLEF